MSKTLCSTADVLAMGAIPCKNEITPAEYSASRIVVAVLAVAALLAALAPALIQHVRSSSEHLFWDGRVYARAIHAFQTGGTPYARDSALTFVYPPLFLFVASAVSRLVHGEVMWRGYLLTSLLMLLAIPFLLSEGYFRSRWFSPCVAVGVFVVHPLFTGMYAYETGNVANVLYPLLLATAIPGLRQGRWLPFYFAVMLAATIKLPLLSFLLLPLLLGERQLVRSSLTAGAVLAVGTAQWIAYPADWHAYLQAVRYQMLDRNNIGIGIFAAFLHLTQHSVQLPKVTPLLVHTLLFGLLAAGMALARFNGMLQQAPQWFSALTVLLALLANPRMVLYDLAMLVVPMAFLMGDIVRCACSRRVAACVLLGAYACWFLSGSFALVACYTASLLCFPLGAYAWCRSCAVQPVTTLIRNAQRQAAAALV